MPTFDTIETSSPGRSAAWMIDSISFAIRSVSSTRVPIGLLHPRADRRLEVDPELRLVGRREELVADQRPEAEDGRGESVSMPSKKRTETRNTRSVTRRERGSIGVSGWSTRRASSGVTVRETRNEAKSEIEIVKV